MPVCVLAGWYWPGDSGDGSGFGGGGVGANVRSLELVNHLLFFLLLPLKKP